MTKDTTPKKFLNTRTVSYLLGISVSTLTRMRSNGNGPSFHVFGSSIRYSVDDLKTYIEKNRAEPP